MAARGARDWAEWGARELEHKQMESDDDLDVDLGLPADGAQVIGASFEELDLGDLESPEKRPHQGTNGETSDALELPRLAAGGIHGDAKIERSRSAKVIRKATKAVKILVKTLGLGMFVLVLFVSVINWPPWMIENENSRVQVMTVLFAAGLFIVAVEEIVGINKSAMMMVMAAVMWTFLAVGFHPNSSKAGAQILHEDLARGLEDVGSVLLFLLPAMGVVESIDHFDGFAIVTLLIRRSTRGRQERLMPIITILTFFLSSVIDNLTATIVAIKILRHLVPDDDELRKLCGGLAVIASNAGGAWSPIGDVTTTMLWIQDKISATATVFWLFIPSAVCGIVPLIGIMWTNRHPEPAESDDPAARHRKKDKKIARWEQEPLHEQFDDDDADMPSRKSVVALSAGVVCILMVPALKMGTGLPPYLGMLLALGVIWLLTDVLGFVGHEEEEALNGEHAGEHDGPPTGGVVTALKKVDLTGLLFFTGVLLAVGALDSAGVLRRYADEMKAVLGDSPIALTIVLGLSSALVDNVPLVEAAIDMFKDTEKDDALWQLVALAAGTGGSCLAIGSIAGVTLMSMEGVGFIWYCRKISIWALIGFFMAIGTYSILDMIF